MRRYRRSRGWAPPVSSVRGRVTKRKEGRRGGVWLACAWSTCKKGTQHLSPHAHRLPLQVGSEQVDRPYHPLLAVELVGPYRVHARFHRVAPRLLFRAYVSRPAVRIDEVTSASTANIGVYNRCDRCRAFSLCAANLS